MSNFLFDTLVWTGALLVLVLLIRRPVAAAFGPQAAYALWLLPMARLILPPLVLPAWMAPASEPLPEIALDAALVPAMTAIDLLPAGAAAVSFGSGSHTLSAAPVEPAPWLLGALAEFDWASLLVPVWLAGAAVFLIRRYALYFEMRRQLLTAARPMGEAGRVRLVETPATDGPVAFGVLDKVIALPPGFMAGPDRAARDLALAHELAHHRGHDLLCNMLVQPLFALHWFTPLATLGWRALRRDQEAACDARVIARCPRESRAAYATVIAHFATQPQGRTRLALAAPMACPVLGDRSIVQRLKSLAMTDLSHRRRWAGRLLIGGAALALPLTGSISYAQDDRAREPVAPPSAPDAPQAPDAPAAARAPAAPDAPSAATAPSAPETRIVRIERRVKDGSPDDKRIEKRVILRDGREMDPAERAEFEKNMAEHGAEMAKLGKEMGEIQREIAVETAEIQREIAHDKAEIARELAHSQAEIQREIRLAVAEGQRARPQVRVQCRNGQRDVAETVSGKHGETIFVCQAVAMAEARKGLASARAEIARSRDLSASERAEALRAIAEAERATRAD